MEQKREEILIAALKASRDAGEEQRLYRGAKLPGLFPGREELFAQVAEEAVRAGLIEITRTESRGKTTTTWARVSPKGMDYLARHESPAEAIRELSAILKVQEAGLPLWLEGMRRDLDEMGRRLAEEMKQMGRRLEILTERVREGLARAEKPDAPAGMALALPWDQDVLSYLERRPDVGRTGQCPLSELFAAVKSKEIDLSLRDFHAGIRRLHDRGAIRLLPHQGDGLPPAPEYALLDGAAMYYYAAK